MKQKIFLIFVFFITFANIAWAGDYYAKVTAVSRPTAAGYAYVYGGQHSASDTYNNDGTGGDKESNVNLNVRAVVADESYAFSRWQWQSGSNTGTIQSANSATSQLTVKTAKNKWQSNAKQYTIEAIFKTYWAQLSTTIEPAGAGTAYVGTSQNPGSVTPASKNIASSGGSVQLYVKATPTDNYTFTRWEFTSGSGTISSNTSASTMITVNASSTATEGNEAHTNQNYTIKAVFTAKPKPTFYFSATATPSPTAGGTASVTLDATSKQGTSWNSTSATTTARFSASANSGYEFVGWSTSSEGTSIESTNNPYNKTVTSTSTNSSAPTNTKLYAIFKQKPTFYFSATAVPIPSEWGSASVSPSSASQTGDHWNTSSANTSVAFTATPNNGCFFKGWSTSANGSIESTANPYNKTITSSSTNSESPANTTLYAIFSQDPIAISASNMSLSVGETNPIIPILTPAGANSNLTFSSSNTSIASVNSSGEVTGVAAGATTITIKALKNDNTEACRTTITVTVKDKVETPVIAFSPTGDGSQATTTITCATDGTTIYYTTDGSTPTTSSTPYTESFSVDEHDVVTAIAVRIDGQANYWNNSDVAISEYVACTSAVPTILINGDEVTFSSTDVNVTFYYTTGANPDDPTTSSSSWTAGSTAVTGLSSGNVIKAIAKSGACKPSSVVSKIYYQPSGVSGGVVTLNDLEDHTWTYYAGVPTEVDGGNYNTNYEGKLYSPNPRNIKITYLGNGKLADLTTSVSGVKVGIDAPENTFVYYKTIENNSGYKYTTIPNPFSVRPKINSTYYGFSSWRVKTVTGGSISGKAVGSTINAETEITFVPTDANGTGYTTNCISMEVELEAVWDVAEVSTNGTFTNNYGVERMFYVMRSDGQDITANGKACTYTSIYPNGTKDGSTAATMNDRTDHRGGFTPAADSKFEYIIIHDYNNSSTVTVGSHNLTYGRGITTTGNKCATNLQGISANANGLQYKLRVESGYFQYMMFTSGRENLSTARTISGNVNINVTLGCDYDRAKNDNTKFKCLNDMIYGYDVTTSGISAGNQVMKTVFKSGELQSDATIDKADLSDSYYIGIASVSNPGYRIFEMEGGIMKSLAAGICTNTATTNSIFFRIKGGLIQGSIYGSAANSTSYGYKRIIITGGQVKGWVAAGGNGTSANGGYTYGTSYVYIGGKTRIDSEGSTTAINSSLGGNVFGSGSGVPNTTTWGEMTYGSNVVIADNSYVERDVYGGGNYGWTLQSANIYVTGGDVEGSVFGGANQNKGEAVNINMTGGFVKTGIYGGSNSKGTISENVTINLNGGQVGVSGTPANVHGGGYGSSTRVTGNVDIKLGKSVDQANPITIFGDVYGGSALGYVNGTSVSTSKHTNVTLNAGTINGSLYGGGLGASGTAANVYAPVAVKVYGGSVKQTSADGSGGVYGANNVNGAPQSTVTVDIYGTDPAPAINQYALYSVYGGGNKANYTYNGGPKVTVHNCDNSIEYVYGGGNAAKVDATNVTIYGGNAIGNIFGGGNGTVSAANVDHNVSTKIYGGTILNVFGGSNSQGTIGGEINVLVYSKQEGSNDLCTMNIGNLYGGGNRAASKVGKINIACTGTNGQINTVYGGANAANITGNIDLKISGGKIGTVYGGNNASGTISGNIAVTVDKDTNNCGILDIGTVFGGGNEADLAQAANTVTVTVGGENTTTTATKIGNIYGGGNKASVYSTSVTVKNGKVTGDVFGGGKGTVNSTKTMVLGGGTNVNIYGGSVANVFGGNDAGGTISGTLNVVVDKTQGDDGGNLNITQDVYGGGNHAASAAGNININCANHINTVYGGAKEANITGDIVLNVGSGQIDNVFGGNNIDGSITGGITVNIDKKTGDCGDNFSVGNVYGAGNLAQYSIPTGKELNVNIKNGSITGNVYGGGKGDANDHNKGKVTGNPKVYIGVADNDKQVAIAGDVYGGGDAGNVVGSPEVTLIKGSVRDVFGGGNLADITGATTILENGVSARNLFGGGNNAGVSSTTAITMNSGTVSTGLYGGCNTSGTVGGNITVDLKGGTVGTNGTTTNTVFGGGYGSSTATNGNVTLTLGTTSAGPTIYGSVYGGSALGNVNDATSDITKVQLKNGTINGSLYGGGLGDNEHAALVKGAVQVIVDGGTVSDKVFGCNNINGTPKGAVSVTINGTGAHTPATESTSAVYALSEVYGGGNQANYVPTSNTDKATVVVNGCDNSIGVVYGGGNAADVPATDVTIWGGTIGQVFGGGHGDKSANPQTEANVGGNVAVKVYGGTINQVFGGSNSKGDIDGTVSVVIDKGENTCDMIIAEVYGGGNAAEGNAGTLSIRCTGTKQTEGIGTVYGGANAADINNSIELNITGGKIANVFGGNNTEGDVKGNVVVNITGGQITNVFGENNAGGNVEGSVTVNVNQSATDDCNKASSLANVYGGGKDAQYTPTTPGAYPAVNIKGGTISQNVYGGGLGSTATVTSNPLVTVSGGTVTGNVFGGGSQAPTTGNPAVSLTGGTVSTDVYGGGALADVTGSTSVTLNGTSVTGNVYGGGLGNATTAANISGSTTVTVSSGSASNIFGCNNVKGAPTGAVVTISGGTIADNIYGGGNQAAASVSPSVTINGGIMDNVYGGGLGAPATITGSPTVNINKTETTMTVVDVFGGGDAAAVSGSNSVCTVKMQQGSVSHIFGGGNQAGVVSTDVNMSNGTVTAGLYGGCNTSGIVSGDIAVDVTGGTVGADEINKHANVHGGGYGENTSTNSNVTVTIGDDSNGPDIYGDVYGGSALGSVNDAASEMTKVWLKHGTIHGNLYGGGLGDATHAAAVNGATQVVVNDGNVKEVFGCNNVNGAPAGGASVTINGGTIDDNVYGGGNLAAASVSPAVTITGGTMDNVYGGGLGATATVTGDPAVTINKGASASMSVTNIYGGGALAPVTGNPSVTMANGSVTKVFAGGQGSSALVTGNTTAQINGGTVSQDVYGGGEEAAVTGSVAVTVSGGTVSQDVYGGGALANTNTASTAETPKTTTVNLIGGTVSRDVYGGGLGRKASEGVDAVSAEVNGPVTVTLSGTKVSRVFGCNNVNGTPKDTVMVIVEQTTARTDGEHDYHVDAVYGGGNEAEYVPTSHSSYVYIKGCNNNIQYVYGGGNAASSPATHVVVDGGTMDYVFGGGNGAGIGNPGANVGYHQYDYDLEGDALESAKSAAQYGTGVATTEVQGGVINHLFGGSNTKGNIRATAVTMVDQPTNGCDMTVGEVYGAGNEAYMDGTVDLQLGCIDGFKSLYGGAKKADINQDINLTITSGKFGQVFGGNNLGGTINGSITVNIEETGCKPIQIGELYGAGNQADYTVPTGKNGPTINVVSCTKIGKVFGGGFGVVDPNDDTHIMGTVTGDTYVNINMIKGEPNGKTSTKLGVIGNVYGGGKNAPVVGSTHVNIGTEEEVTLQSVSSNKKRTVEGANIDAVAGFKLYDDEADNVYGGEGNVFGGGLGNTAVVTGNTNVIIQGGSQIGNNVYGGGSAADVNGNTNVQIGGTPNPAPSANPTPTPTPTRK